MTNEQILKKAIEKAVENGYKGFIIPVNDDFECQCLTCFWENKDYFTCIFSHDFAKAFWGEGVQWFCMYCGQLEPIFVNVINNKCKKCNHDAETLSAWTYYLMKMVLIKEPLKYLEKFLEVK